MIVGIDASRANLPQKTGTEHYAFDLIRALAELKERPNLRLYADHPLESGLRDLGPGIETAILRWPMRRFWTQGRLSLEMLSRPPDVLFVPSHVLPLVHPHRAVTTLHDVGFLRFPELYEQKELHYHRWAARFAIRHARRILVPSFFTKKEILELTDCPEEKLVVIHHGFNATPFRSADPTQGNSLLREQGIDGPFALFIGRLEEKKNIPRLVEAFLSFVSSSEQENPYLLLVGKPGYQFEKVERMLTQQKQRDRVRTLGFLDDATYRSLLTLAKCFVFPSNYEGFGFPVLEAQAAGVPVIASSTTSLPEIAGEGALLVDPANISSMSAAIEKLFRDENAAALLKQKGRQNIERFSWERCAQQTMSVLASAS